MGFSLWKAIKITNSTSLLDGKVKKFNFFT